MEPNPSNPIGSAPPPPRLVNITPRSKREVIPLGRVMLLIGRGGAHLEIQDAVICPNHASIILTDGKFFLRDNGSINGSYVNDLRIAFQELKHDDVIRFGSYQFLVDLGALEAAHHRSDYPLVTIPASHRGERFKFSYEFDAPAGTGGEAMTIVSSGGTGSRAPGREKTSKPKTVCIFCKRSLESHFVYCPHCGTKQHTLATSQGGAGEAQAEGVGTP